MNYSRPMIGVGVAVISGKKILMGKRTASHGSGTWSFAGGHLEFSETFEECARRELKEETSLIAEKLKIGPWISTIFENKHYISFLVKVLKFSGELSLNEPDKCECWKWFSLDELPSPLFPPTKQFIEKISF